MSTVFESNNRADEVIRKLFGTDVERLCYEKSRIEQIKMGNPVFMARSFGHDGVWFDYFADGMHVGAIDLSDGLCDVLITDDTNDIATYSANHLTYLNKEPIGMVEAVDLIEAYASRGDHDSFDISFDYVEKLGVVTELIDVKAVNTKKLKLGRNAVQSPYVPRPITDLKPKRVMGRRSSSSPYDAGG